MKTETNFNPGVLRAMAANNLAAIVANMERELFPSLVLESTAVMEYLKRIEDDLVNEKIPEQTQNKEERHQGINQRRVSMRETDQKERQQNKENNAKFKEEIEEEIEKWLKSIELQVAESLSIDCPNQLKFDPFQAQCVKEISQVGQTNKVAPSMLNQVEQIKQKQNAEEHISKETVKEKSSNEAMNEAVRSVIILNEIALNEAILNEIALNEAVLEEIIFLSEAVWNEIALNEAENSNGVNKEMNDRMDQPIEQTMSQPTEQTMSQPVEQTMKQTMDQKMKQTMDGAVAEQELNFTDDKKTDKSMLAMESNVRYLTEEKDVLRNSRGPPDGQCKFRLRYKSKRTKNPFSQQYDQLTDQHLVQYFYNKTSRPIKTSNSRRKPDAGRVNRNTYQHTQNRKSNETAYSMIHSIEPFDTCELISINQSIQKSKNKENTAIKRMSEVNRKIKLKQPQNILESRTCKLEEDVMLRVPFLRTLGVKFK